EIFRSAIKNKTPLGKEVKSILDSGELVPDNKVVGLVEDELQKSKYEGGYILDGFPRTLPQARAFDDILKKNNESLKALLLLKVREEEVIERIVARGEGRSEDTREGVITRLRVYEEEARAVLSYYRKQNAVEEVKGIGSIEDIFHRITQTLSE